VLASSFVNFSNRRQRYGRQAYEEAAVTAVYAHRGVTNGYVENTLEAFDEAKRLGADGVELDVRLTADGALAVHHDPVIDGLGPVAGLTVPQLLPHVPLLREALAVCEGLVVNVEIKNDPAEPGHDPGEAVAAVTASSIAEAGWTDRVIVSSFQLSTLRAVQAADRGLRLGALWPFLADADAGLSSAVDEGWFSIHPFVTSITPDLVERAHQAGLAVHVWTVNAPHDLAAFVALGVDGLITDHLVEALAIARAGAGGD
jgi:glycerophosphoryl diester phosphodiesterase